MREWESGRVKKWEGEGVGEWEGEGVGGWKRKRMGTIVSLMSQYTSLLKNS